MLQSTDITTTSRLAPPHRLRRLSMFLATSSNSSIRTATSVRAGTARCWRESLFPSRFRCHGIRIWS